MLLSTKKEREQTHMGVSRMYGAAEDVLKSLDSKGCGANC